MRIIELGDRKENLYGAALQRITAQGRVSNYKGNGIFPTWEKKVKSRCGEVHDCGKSEST